MKINLSITTKTIITLYLVLYSAFDTTHRKPEWFQGPLKIVLVKPKPGLKVKFIVNNDYRKNLTSIFMLFGKRPRKLKQTIIKGTTNRSHSIRLQFMTL